jgi:hypothetical protein
MQYDNAPLNRFNVLLTFSACCSGLSEKEVKDQIATHIIDIFNPQIVREFR